MNLLAQYATNSFTILHSAVTIFSNKNKEFYK